MVFRLVIAISLLTIFCNPEAGAQQRDGAKYHWDLEYLYPTQQAWDAEIRSITDKTKAIGDLRGSLGRSPNALIEGLDRISELRARVMKMNVYASLFTDSDSNSKLAISRYDTATSLQAQVETAVAFMPGEVSAIGEKQLIQWKSLDPRLDRHWIRIQRILREAPHTLPANEQAIVASMARWPLLAADTYWAVQDSPLGWPKMPDRTGQLTPVTMATYRTKFSGTKSITATKLL